MSDKEKHIGIAIAKSMDSLDSVDKWKTVPLRQVENAGYHFHILTLRAFISRAQSKPVMTAPLTVAPAYTDEVI